MIIPLRMSGTPAARGGGLLPGFVDAAEVGAATSWWSADLFTKGFYSARSTDEKIELLNNYWQLLWRSAMAQGPLPAEVGRRLDADMGNWEAYRVRYGDAILRRAFDPRDAWAGGLQSSFERELGTWKNRYLDDLKLVTQALPATAEDLIAKGVDPDTAFKEFPSPNKDFSFWWGMGAVVLLMGFGAWAAFSSEGYRRSQRPVVRRRPPAGPAAAAPAVSFEPRRRRTAAGAGI